MQHFDFYYCMENAVSNMLNDVQKCAKTANISYSTLSTCYNGPESNKLQAAAATATPADHKVGVIAVVVVAVVTVVTIVIVVAVVVAACETSSVVTDLIFPLNIARIIVRSLDRYQWP